MEQLIDSLANVTQQIDQLIASGQTVIEGLSAALSMLAQLAGFATQVMDFLASL